MNVFRGAAVFFVFVILVAIVQCRKEEQPPPSATTTTQSVSVRPAVGFKPCDSPVTPSCPQGDTCTVTLSVEGDNITVTPDPVYVSPGQHVVWSVTSSGKASVESTRVSYLKKGEKFGNKPVGDHDPRRQPKCNDKDKCVSTYDDVDPCKIQTYYAIVKITGDPKAKKTDPELEVAGTSTGITGTVVTTATTNPAQ